MAVMVRGGLAVRLVETTQHSPGETLREHRLYQHILVIEQQHLVPWFRLRRVAMVLMMKLGESFSGACQLQLGRLTLLGLRQAADQAPPLKLLPRNSWSRSH